jgi:hypothetical protein
VGEKQRVLEAACLSKALYESLSLVGATEKSKKAAFSLPSKRAYPLSSPS